MEVQPKPVNLIEKLTRFNEHWQPRVIAAMNDYQFKLVKIKGRFVWHNHKDTDEVFIVLKGEMIIEFRASQVLLKENEMIVVPKGTGHRPVAENECHVLIVEPKDLVNTGTQSAMTAANDVWI